MSGLMVELRLGLGHGGLRRALVSQTVRQRLATLCGSYAGRKEGPRSGSMGRMCLFARPCCNNVRRGLLTWRPRIGPTQVFRFGAGDRVSDACDVPSLWPYTVGLGGGGLHPHNHVQVPGLGFGFCPSRGFAQGSVNCPGAWPFLSAHCGAKQDTSI